MLEAPVVSTPGGSALRTARGRKVSAVSVSFRLRSTSVLVPEKKRLFFTKVSSLDDNNGDWQLSS